MNKLRKKLRKKVALKCECGKAVAAGSVFCSSCLAAINRKNARTMKKEERSYHKKMRKKGQGKKK